jgi:hypothetical protein
MGFARVSWVDDEPARFARELDAMPAAAPDLQWTGSCWEGLLPLWPFDRPAPWGLTEFACGRRFRVEVHYLESFPMVAPRFLPIDPQPEIAVWTMNRWHVAGDGSLCLFQNFTDWHPLNTAADLVPKAAGWFLEFLLMKDGVIDAMSTGGIAVDDSLDHLLRGPQP